MNVFSLLSYLNKISLVAFFITAGFLFYQIYLLRKGSKPKQEKPSIPDFNENMKIDVANYTKLPPSLTTAPITVKKDNKAVLIVLSSLGVLTVVLFFVISFRSRSTAPKTPQVSIRITSTPTPKLKPSLSPSSSPTASEPAGLSPSPTAALTITPTTEPSIEPSETPTPTEVILAVISPTTPITESPVPTSSVSPTTITSLPTTGIIDRSLAIFAVASLLIFFSFIF